MIKRFKITDPSGRTENKKYTTIKEVIADLRSEKRDMAMQNYYIEDLIDDIQIDSDELLEVWENGERPEDLQFF